MLQILSDLGLGMEHSHWLSIDTRKKIGKLLGTVMNVLVVDSGGPEGRHIKLLSEIDLTKPLVKGTKLRYKQNEIWIQFRYEQLPLFCYYCGCIGHTERMYIKRKDVLNQQGVKENEYGSWLRASSIKAFLGRGYSSRLYKERV